MPVHSPPPASERKHFSKSRMQLLSRAASSMSLRVLAWMAVGTILYFCKPAIAPILFSMLIALLLSPVVDSLERNHIPRSIASLGIICILLAAFAVIVDAAWSPAQRWVQNAPEVLQSIEKKIRPVQLIVARIDSITTRATTIASGPVATTEAGKVAPKPSDINPISTARTFLIDTVTISILTLFLLIGGSNTLRAVEDALQGGEAHTCMRVIESVRSELSRYYLTLAMINICLGTAVGCAMAWWGLPSPWLWGIMSAALNFIPYIGPAVSLAILTIVALVTFEGYGNAIGVASTFLFLTTIEGQLVQPLLVGFRLNLNPIVLFVAIWLGGWFWGVVGIFLTMPTLVILKEVANMKEGNSLLKALLVSNYQPPLTRYRHKKALRTGAVVK